MSEFTGWLAIPVPFSIYITENQAYDVLEWQTLLDCVPNLEGFKKEKYKQVEKREISH